MPPIGTCATLEAEISKQGFGCSSSPLYSPVEKVLSGEEEV